MEQTEVSSSTEEDKENDESIQPSCEVHAHGVSSMIVLQICTARLPFSFSGSV